MTQPPSELQIPGLFNRTTLPNGLRIVSESIPSVRSISMGLWVEAGSRDESEQDAGICHFIEHMVFKGTARRRMHQIAERLESVGGYLNAFTSKEYTCFYARTLDEHLDRALDLLTDLILDPTFPEKELQKEKEVVVEEMKMYEDSPEDLIFDMLESELYPDHPMGRPVIGLEASVRSFDRERLQEFMKEHYTPDRTIVAVAGNVDHERLVRQVEKAYAGRTFPASEVNRSPLKAPAPRTVVASRPIQQAHLVMATPGFDAQSRERFALSALNTLVGGGMSSVLNQNIREKYGYCYNIYSFFNLYSDGGEFGVYMGTDRSKVARSRKLILRELGRIADKPISPRRMRRIRNQVKGSVMLSLESMDSRMMRLGRQEVYYRRYDSLDDIINNIEAVTESDVLRVARRLFDPDRFSYVELLPDA
jgi:predicted Zn-dependent peptidase